MNNTSNHSIEELNQQARFYFQKAYVELSIQEKDWIAERVDYSKSTKKESISQKTDKRDYIEIEDIKKMWAGYVMWLFGWHYLYYNKFKTWILFVCTPLIGAFFFYTAFFASFTTNDAGHVQVSDSFGLDIAIFPIIGILILIAFGLWWFIDLFRIPKMTEQENKRLAMKKYWGRIYI